MIEYEGKIRNGKFRTEKDSVIHRCPGCDLMRLDDRDVFDNYESNLYRNVYGPSFFKEHWRIINKLLPSEKLRDKVVMDVGAGDGAFLRYVQLHANSIIAIEANKEDRESYPESFDTYSDITECRKKADIITCFAVIEHVQAPRALLIDILDRLSSGGYAVISTPNAEDFLIDKGKNYLEFFFRTAHKWYFTQRTLSTLLSRAGFSNIQTHLYHRFGIGNAVGWVLFGKPFKKSRCSFLLALDMKWKLMLEEKGTADYIYMVAK